MPTILYLFYNMKNTYEAIKVDDLCALHSALSSRALLSNKRPYLYYFIITREINYFKNFMNNYSFFVINFFSG